MRLAGQVGTLHHHVLAGKWDRRVGMALRHHSEECVTQLRIGMNHETPAPRRGNWLRRATFFAALTLAAASIDACAGSPPPEHEPSPDDNPDGPPMRPISRRLKLGISVLLEDSIKLVAGKRVG